MNEVEREVVEYLRNRSGFNWTAKLKEERAVRDDGWEHDVWVVSLSRHEHTTTFLYHTGMGHRRRGKPASPHIAGVLFSLLSDAASSDVHFFKWADEFGFSRDSRKALDVYLQCGETAEKLSRIFSGSERAELARTLEDY